MYMVFPHFTEENLSINKIEKIRIAALQGAKSTGKSVEQKSKDLTKAERAEATDVRHRLWLLC